LAASLSSSETQHLPESERPAFAIDVLDHYQQVAADAPGEANFFRFYQMDIMLAPAKQDGKRSFVA
jgi:hypothetical protein